MSRRPFDAACVPDVAPVRAEPDDAAEQVTQALGGEPLWVDGRDGGWARVRTFYGYPGWMRADALGAAPDSWSLPAGGDAVGEARRFLGSPYEWGGMSERGVDCSGLVHMAYRRAGFVVPRDAHEQEDAGEPVAEPRPGDLVTYGASSADHIAFWLGGGRILHATGRDGVERVVEEPEPPDLRRRRRRFVRLGLPRSSDPNEVARPKEGPERDR